MQNKKKIFKDFFSHVLKYKKIPPIDFHLHTNWTDGSNTVREVFKKCEKVGLQKILYSEHSRKSSGKWFKKFSQQVRSIKNGNCKVYVGTEVKILDFKGNIDINNQNLKLCDYIMASVHRFPGEKNIKKNNIFFKKKNKDVINTELKLIIAACKNKNVDILGHPFGMAIKRFKIMPQMKFFEEIIINCKKYNKVFEVNFHYHQKIFKKLIKLCIKHNCLMSFGSNSHNISKIKNLSKVTIS